MGRHAVIRLLYVVSHPIQYQAPLLRLIAADPAIHLTVLFLRLPDNAMDPGFGRTITWDVPLVEGYDHAVLDIRTLTQALGESDVVWLHGWQGWTMKAVLLAAWLRRIPVLMRGENWDGAMPDPRGWRGLAKRAGLAAVFALCGGFLAIGRKNADYYRQRGVAAGRVFTMPYAVDNDFFARHAAGDPLALRDRLGLPRGRSIVLFAGKLMRRKHPHTLLEAWRQAFGKGDDRPLLVFVGDGEMAPHIATGEPDVYLLGFRNQTEMPALYALADIFVLAAEREAWGLAINEAMACGTAIIVSNQCGAAYDLVDETVGAMVPPGDVTALAEALRRVLPQAGAMGATAQRRMEAWDFRADLRGLHQALRSVTDVGRGGGAA
jgi:glycosyltransferase involved in cell wall biosynthesis